MSLSSSRYVMEMGLCPAVAEPEVERDPDRDPPALRDHHRLPGRDDPIAAGGKGDQHEDPHERRAACVDSTCMHLTSIL